jgi:RNA polymerase sigma-70 factor (ECF subfamily)
MDAELLARWQAGDSAAGQELFSLHFDALHRFFANTCDEPDELTQMTFLACLRAKDHFRGESSFRTYLFAIARNQLFAHTRRRKQSLEVRHPTAEFANAMTTAGTRLAKDREQERIRTALRELPLAQQTLLELHYWQGLNAEELAVVFETNAAAVRVRLHRARQALRERLGGEMSPDLELRSEKSDG